MKLVIVDIKENQKEKYYPQNALQYIGRAESAMFVRYSEDNDGGNVYMLKEEVFRAITPSLDTHGIDFVIISKHHITTKWDKE